MAARPSLLPTTTCWATAPRYEYAVLVLKQKDRPVPPALALYGFETPDRWLTGMGMDDWRRSGQGAKPLGRVNAIAND